jgi:hypothetical protein
MLLHMNTKTFSLRVFFAFSISEVIIAESCPLDNPHFVVCKRQAVHSKNNQGNSHGTRRKMSMARQGKVARKDKEVYRSNFRTNSL